MDVVCIPGERPRSETLMVLVFADLVGGSGNIIMGVPCQILLFLSFLAFMLLLLLFLLLFAAVSFSTYCSIYLYPLLKK